MKKVFYGILVFMLSLCTFCSALAASDGYVNKSPDLISNVVVMAVGDTVACFYGEPAVSFDLKEDASVKVYAPGIASPHTAEILGHGRTEGTLWLTLSGGIELKAGHHVLNWTDGLFVHKYEDKTSQWPGTEWINSYQPGFIYLEAAPTGDETPDEGEVPVPDVKPEQEEKPNEGTDSDEDNTPPADKPSIAYTWYNSNTVNVAGFSLRDEYPALTSKWYNIVPVDLSKDGITKVPLTVGDAYLIGEAVITVTGDEITVNYQLEDGQVYTEQECLCWFTSISEITNDFLSAPDGNAEFGTAVSRTNDLNSAETGILFICNRVTYSTPLNEYGAMPERYWRNAPDWVEWRNSLRPLLESIN